MAREGRDCSRTSRRTTAGTTSCRAQDVAAKLPPGADRARPHPDRRPGRVSPTRWSTATRTTSARASASRGVSTRQQERAARRRSGSSTRPWPSRASATCSRPTSSAIHHASAAAACATASRAARRSSTRPTSATRASTRTSRAPTSTSTTSRRARDARQHGRARQLHRLDDAEAAERSGLQHAAGQHGAVRSRRSRTTTRGCRIPLYGYYMDIVANRASGQFHAAQFELLRRYKGGLGGQRRLHAGALRQQRARHRQRTIGPVQFDPYDIEKDRGPDPNVVKHRFVANATWDIPVGHGRQHGANMPKWADALFGGWTVSTIVQARSGQHLTPFFSGFYTTSPWNTGKPLDGLGNCFCCAWRPDQITDPNTGGSRDAFFDQTAYAIPATGQAREREEGQPEGPRHVGGELRVLQGRDAHEIVPAAVLGAARQRVQPPAVLPDVRERVRRPHVALVDGDPNNGTTGVLGADTIANTEGFSPGRVIRLGIRAISSPREGAGALVARPAATAGLAAEAVAPGVDAGIARRPRPRPSASTSDSDHPARPAAARRRAAAPSILDLLDARRARHRRGARRSIRRVGGDDPRRSRCARRVRGARALARRRDPKRQSTSPTCRSRSKRRCTTAKRCGSGMRRRRSIRDGDTIILDSGTTTAEIARQLKSLKLNSLTVITNGLNIAMELASLPQIRVIMIGGMLRQMLVLDRRPAGRADAARALRRSAVPRRRRPRSRRSA